MRQSPDLNADLGEGETPERTAALMRWITSANIACGGHAGDEESMRRCVRLALAAGVRLGAHPGLPGGFGRGRAEISVEALASLIREQVTRLARVCAGEGTSLAHVKLHGALYHLSDETPGFTEAYVTTMKRDFPGLVIVARSSGAVVSLARKAGVAVREEAFLDRGYRSDGTLVPRGEPGALLHEAAAVVERLNQWLVSGTVTTVEGGSIGLAADTWCLHGDGESAEAIAEAVGRWRQRLET